MTSVFPSKSSDEYIDLHRTFHKLPQNSGKNDYLESTSAFHFGELFHWDDLIKEYRLVILSEAGSGKTAEIKNITLTLRQEGKSAFFLRLENISSDFEDAFEVGTYDDFEKWLGSSEEGWIFLDSVDEARLRGPSDFELAIRKLSRRIKNVKDQAHIVITGRTTAWRPETDLAYCEQHLPHTAITTLSETQAEDLDPNGSIQTKTELDKEKQPMFKTFTLNDLTRDQIGMFANAHGIEDSQAFLNEVERSDAWSFTSRPQDLKELTEFWLDKGCIGTRLELMRNSIDRRLKERDPGRADARPLTAERVRQGAKLIAAATTLIQNPEIRIPDGVENTKGIAVQSVLPDWDEREQSTLLMRPIFDEAIYGTVRFHHRSVREYLAAEWFAELLKREISRRRIETLFCRNQYGLDIIVPTLRPILAWLIILDETLGERVRKVKPEIVFECADPSQLPVDVRRDILCKVCEQIANGSKNLSMQSYTIIQRFANPDLSHDVRVLLKEYAGNKELPEFLLRMIWLGQLADTLPEVMDFALKSTTENHTRIEAFKAIKAIGSSEDQDHVRQRFLNEAPELKREWLAELIKDVQPTEQTMVWLLACLKKSAPKERYSVDYVTDSVIEFVSSADIELLPQLIAGLNQLLRLPPMIERMYCEVSQNFQWLMAPACEAVKRLIEARHPASLEANALTILHNFLASLDYRVDYRTEIVAEFSKLVPAWQELNWALFWFEVRKSREALSKNHGIRLTIFSPAQVSNSRPFWQFDESDFESATEEISHQILLDDRLVALSLAFNLYKVAHQPEVWCDQLKKVVSGNDELSECLDTYLKPSPPSQAEKHIKQQLAEQKLQIEAQRKKQEKYHADWKKFFNEKLHAAREAIQKQPGALTQPLLYLFDQTQPKKTSTGRWTEYNWKTLIPEYGEEVANFYRDSAVSFFRHYEPKLRSEGAPPGETPYAVIFGLTGLEIEASEVKDWAQNLSSVEVKRACKYASFELNGFPFWFPKLFEAHSTIVCNFLMQEIRYELEIETPDNRTHYIISKLCHSGQWAWEHLASNIYNFLKKEPKNLSNLDKLLQMLQGATNISDDLIGKLSSRKCRTLKKHEHLARWFAVWTGVDPNAALEVIEVRIANTVNFQEQTSFAMIFITHLLGGSRGNGTATRTAYRMPEHLKVLYMLMHKYIRCDEDIDRIGTGAYTPELRDDAQSARETLLRLLIQLPGKASFLALMDIAQMHPDEALRLWILHDAKEKAEQDGDIQPWSPSQLMNFQKDLEVTPKNHRELAELSILRLLDLKDDLENGDSSIAGILLTVPKETQMRNYIGRELRQKAFGRYTIPQEEELADAKRPDLRFHGVGFDGPVPIELKLADKWSGKKLFERLKNQLCGDYLRDNRSSRGIFLLVYRGEQNTWKLSGNSSVDFAGLTDALQNHWQEISSTFPYIDEISIIGIDLTRRGMTT